MPQCALFVQSITGHFARNSLDDHVEVNCSLENNHFILSDAENGIRTQLMRARFCPFKHLSDAEAASLTNDVTSRGVDVGVAVLLQTANRRLLLTRRAASLRIFPNVWVPPGGHIELDETLIEAGLRELKEETGLALAPCDVTSSQLLGLWESVYPPMLSRGLPKRHHIVTYMLLQSSLTHLQLQACLKPEPAEVSGCLWADASLVRGIVLAVDGEEEPIDLPADMPQSVSVLEVSSTGELRDSVMPAALLCNRAPEHGEDVERVSTGTKYALELWLKTLQQQPQG